jgi:hypothetical protein
MSDQFAGFGCALLDSFDDVEYFFVVEAGGMIHLQRPLSALVN